MIARRSVFAKFLLSTVAAVLCALAVVALFLPRLVENFLLEAKERELLLRATQAQAVLAPYLAGQMPEETAQAVITALGATEDSEVWVVDSHGTVVLESGAPGMMGSASGQSLGQPSGPMMPWWAGHRTGRRLRGTHLGGEDVLGVLAGRSWSGRGPRWPYTDPVVSVGVPILGPGGSGGTGGPAGAGDAGGVGGPSGGGAAALGAVYLNSPVAGVARTAAQLARYLVLAGAAGLLASLGIAAVMSRNITSPVRRMNLMAKRMAEGDFELRAATGPDEIGQLGESLNVMAARLSESREESRRLDAMRRDLVANVSHDLRSPVTAIRGFVEPLLDGTVTDEVTRRRYLETIRSETDSLGALVADLLELGRLEAGAASLTMEPLDCGQLAREAAARYEPRAREAGVSLRVELPEGLPAINADEGRVARVLSNLLDNALKFTPRGGEVVLEVEPASGEVRVSVADNGPGIAPEDLPRVWERFYKVDKSRRPEGSGLGLAIVKEIAQAHGGRVAVESRPGEGSRFDVFFPVFGHFSGSGHGQDTNAG